MERHLAIDYFRLALSILVITIHTQPLFMEDSLSGWLISNGIARICVPCFFIISGYFIAERLNENKALKSYLVHISVIYLIWSVIYFPTYYNTIKPSSLVTFALMGYYHLWYLPALIVGVLLLKIILDCIGSGKIILIIAATLFIIGYYMESKELYYRLYCNGVFFGFPFIVLGYCIKARGWIDRFRGVRFYFLLIASFVLLMSESYLGYSTESYKNMMMSLFILCPMLFLLILRHSKIEKSKWDIGKFSAGIYYIHILVISLIIPLSDTYNIYKLPLIIAISMLFAIFIVLINKRIKILL